MRDGAASTAPVEQVAVLVAVVRADDRGGGRARSGRLPRLDEERLAVERLGVLAALEAFELLREVGLDLGDFDERVGRLEALELADDASHFLRVRRSESANGPVKHELQRTW